MLINEFKYSIFRGLNRYMICIYIMFFLKYIAKRFLLSVFFAVLFTFVYFLTIPYMFSPRIEIPIIMSGSIVMIVIGFSINHYIAVSRLGYGLSKETLKTYHKRPLKIEYLNSFISIKVAILTSLYGYLPLFHHCFSQFIVIRT